MTDHELDGKVALVTGGARRIGATISRRLHAEGMNLVIHYRNSKKDAHALQEELHAKRADSVMLVGGDILSIPKLQNLVYETVEEFGHLDVLVNSASSFYPTPMGKADDKQWDDLIGTNLRAPFFLTQAAMAQLKANRGCVVNLADIHGFRSLKNYPIYTAAKAGLIALTRSLARELAPDVRVNAIAPGTILWPERDMDEMTKQRIISRVPLKRPGAPEHIADTVLFLIRDADYITGQVIAVDGGRSVV